MRYLRAAASVLACAMVAACGGGGGGGIATTPPPPVAQNNTSLTNLQFSQDFTAQAGIVQYRLARGTGAGSLRGGAVNGAAQVRYDAASQSYTLIGTTLPASTFGPGNRAATGSGPVITVYDKTTGNRQETLALFNPGAGNSELALTYASYGALQTITDNGASVDVDTAFFTYGVLTSAADMPRTGSATYQTRIDGQFADATGAYILGGSSSFAADFAAGTIAATITPVGQNVVTGGTKGFGTQTIAGRINSVPVGQQFTGQTSGGTYAASLTGYFYGPAAAEIAGAFSLTGAGGAGAGVLIGKKN